MNAKLKLATRKRKPKQDPKAVRKDTVDRWCESASAETNNGELRKDFFKNATAKQTLQQDYKKNKKKTGSTKGK